MISVTPRMTLRITSVALFCFRTGGGSFMAVANYRKLDFGVLRLTLDIGSLGNCRAERNGGAQDTGPGCFP
jgi:hypothetical protein